MVKYNPANLRIKRKYLVWLKEAHGLADASINKAAASIDRYIDYLNGKDLRAFNIEHARSFKRSLAKQNSGTNKQGLSITTVDGILRALKAFFHWLADQNGYRSRITHSDAAYFSTDRKSARAAHSSLWKPHPTPEQMRHVISIMPVNSVIERRNRAFMAFLFLTGSREKAAISVHLQHIDMVSGSVNFDGRSMDVKYGKRFTTTFFPVGYEIVQILKDWISELREDHFFCFADPLFPQTKVGLGANRLFTPVGISKEPWKSPSSAVKIFKEAFANAGFSEFSPHRIRDTIADLANDFCTTPEHYKAWSQNIGHEKVLTTFMNYGSVAPGRQSDLMRSFGEKKFE